MADLPVLFNKRIQRKRRRATPTCIKVEENDDPTTARRIGPLTSLSSSTKGRACGPQRVGGAGWVEPCWALVWIATTIFCRQELCVESFIPELCTPSTSISTRLKVVTQTNEHPSATEEEFQQKRSIASSNFWYSVVSTEDDEEEAELIVSRSHSTRGSDRATTTTTRNFKKIPKLPCVPSLDATGPLPRGAYLTDQFCRVQVAWDVSSLQDGESVQVTQEDVTEMVQTLHRFTDAGFTSFQIKSDNYDHAAKSTNRPKLRAWAEQNIYGALIRDTPSSVLQQHCRLTVPLCLRDAMASNVEIGSKVTYKSTRAAVVESLGRMGSEFVDDLQIQFRPTPTLEEIKYNLDLLDAVQELQRDGLIRAVSGRNMSNQFWQQAQRVGLGSLLETNQMDANLLNPDSIRRTWRDESLREPTSPPVPWTVVSHPLASGWLTDRWWYVDTKKQSAARLYQDLSTNERDYWKRVVTTGPWARPKHTASPNNNNNNNNNNSDGGGGEDDFHHWLNYYQQQILAPLQDMAHKHSTSIAAIVLRWTLQMPHVAGTVVTRRLLPEHCFWNLQRHSSQSNTSSSSSSPERRIQDLRQVFRFELDEQDMERLRELSGPVESNASDSRNDDERSTWLFQDPQDHAPLESGLLIPRGNPFDY